MSLQRTDLNVSPFFDDYSDSKNFHRILFRPTSVQTRELNQAQTILQEQLNRFGKHIFTEGSVVIPGGINTKTAQDAAFISISGTITNDEFEAVLPTLYIRSTVSQLEAKVLKHNAASGADTDSIAIEYQNVASSGSIKTFNAADPCVLFTRDSLGVERNVIYCIVNSVYKAMFVTVKAGVYFLRGHFVQTFDQSVLVKADSSQSAKVGFVIKESIIVETSDESLFSNAQGTENYRAPGAARLKLELELQSSLPSAIDPDFVQLVNFVGGEVQSKVDQTNYSLIENMIAQRTYEESGDYCLANFPIKPLNHLRNALNPQGVYTPENGGDPDKLVYRLGEGVAYVKGYRNELNGFLDIISDKARDTEVINNGVMGSDFGNYIIVNNLTSLPLVDVRVRVSFLDVSSVAIGSFAIRSVKRNSSTEVRLYITDIRFDAGKNLGLVKKVSFVDSSNNFKADLVASVIFNSTTDSAVFRLPYNVIKTMKGNNGQSDTSYSVVRTYDVGTNASGVGTVTLPAGEAFSSINDIDYSVALTGSGTVGTYAQASSVLSIGGSPVGRVLTLNWGAQVNKVVRVSVKVVKQNPQPRSKTLRTQTETLIFANESSKNLAHADIYRLKTVINNQNNLDEKASFSFFDGQRPNWYEVGQLKTLSGNKLTGSWTVEYEWFEHSTGDYFNVDSYGGMAREEIPVTKDTMSKTYQSLADCIDFRPLKDASGNITTLTFNGDIVDPNDNIRFDLIQYLPRIDALYTLPDNAFKIVKGIASETPSAPSVPNGSMRLYNIAIPAYTTNLTNIVFNPIDNRRYTMRDIGKLENRIENVEYYTSLSMLESKVDRINVIDSVTGTNRFKNGFAADGFGNLNVSDVNDSEWAASISLSEGIVRSAYSEKPIEFLVGSKTLIREGAETVTKSYTNVPFISQPIATRTTNVNPYAVFGWAGTVNLTPNTDYWKNVKYAPELVKNGGTSIIDNGVQSLNTFDSVNLSPEKLREASLGFTFNGAIWNGTRWVDKDGKASNVNGNRSAFSSVVERQVSGGDQFIVNNTTSEQVLGIETIPFMREVNTNCKLVGFRPYSRLYCFFNGVDLSGYITPDGGIMGDPLLVGPSGEAVCALKIPSSDSLKFNTGKGVVRFTDSPTDDRDGDFSTDGEAFFVSGGQVETRQRTTTTTTTILRSSVVEFVVQTRLTDPIAQTFQVNERGGCFITRVGIPFATKAKNIPITLQLRRLVNGLPESAIMPFGTAVLKPSDITISKDAKTFSYFEFSEPIYLVDKSEYCIVLVSDTQEYNVYKAVMGEKIIGSNAMVAKQPNVGVFLTSSNSSTWTPNQTEDLTFILEKAAFSTAESTVFFNSMDNKPETIGYNAIATVTGSSTVRLNMKSHGLKTGDTFTLAGLIGGNGILAADLNKLQVVNAYDWDWVEFTAPNNASNTGFIGGDSGTITCNVAITKIANDINSMSVEGTTIEWSLKYLRQGDRTYSDWLSLTPNTIQSLKIQGVNTKSGDVLFKAVLRTDNANVSPQIDKMGFGAVAFGQRLDVDSNVANPVYRYVTKSLKFDNPSTQAKILVGVNLPGDTKMRLYYKALTTGDDITVTKPWVEIFPVKPISNNDKSFQEIEYNISGIGSFVGYKLSATFFGSEPCLAPEMSSLMTIALA